MLLSNENVLMYMYNCMFPGRKPKPPKKGVSKLIEDTNASKNSLRHSGFAI